MRGLRAALRGVDHIYHLASGEHSGKLFETDVEGTKTLIQAAEGSRIQQIIYLSHLNASQSSAFPVLRAKGIAEEHIRKSSIPYTILRSSIVFGPEDNFTTAIARLAQISPGILFLPNQGETYIQPLWVEDLVTSLLWALDNADIKNQMHEIGGSEYFTLRQIVEIVLRASNKKRLLLSTSVPVLRALNLTLDAALPNFPISSFFLDYIATDRTCETDSLPRIFGLMPARFTYRLGYLHKTSWLSALRAKLSKKS